MQFAIKKAFIQYKGVHILLWLILSLIIQYVYYDWEMPFLIQWTPTLLVVAMCAIPTYVAANRLVPRLLYHKKIGSFVGLMLLSAIFNTLFTYFVAGGIYHLMTGKPMFPSLIYVTYISTVLFIANIISITIGCAVKIIHDRFSMEQQLFETEQEKISTELAFLRAQVNPHFLFNVLNTIYFQIHKDNLDARSSVEKLSEMLRYQLYECTTDKIDISKELAYIQNYVAVQQLRMEPGTDVQLHICTGISSFRIAPLLILPIVENAFKHISHHKNPSDNKLHITLTTEGDDYFVTRVSNTFDPTHSVTHLVTTGGLGLQNVKRRLELLYPDAYTLNTTQHDHVFETTLKIQYRD